MGKFKASLTGTVANALQYQTWRVRIQNEKGLDLMEYSH